MIGRFVFPEMVAQIWGAVIGLVVFVGFYYLGRALWGTVRR